MMAARAGAEKVWTCENVPWVASAAKETLRANGMSDKVKLLTQPLEAIEHPSIDFPDKTGPLIEHRPLHKLC